MKKQPFLIFGLLAGMGFMGSLLFALVSFASPIPMVQAEVERIAVGSSWTTTVQPMSALRLVARITGDVPAGGNYAMEVYVNGKPVISSLLNKGASFTFKDGRTFPYRSENGWMLFYSQNFSVNNTAASGGYQVLTDPGQAYLYEWNISSLVGGASSMKLEIKNNGKTAGRQILVQVLSRYPIAELGNCGDENACRDYCGKQANYAACSDYGAKNNIISPEDAEKAKKFADVLNGAGPGGCKDEASCRSYCEGVAHLEECISFAQKHNFASGDQLAEAQKVLSALKKGATLPGGCTDKNSCESYCKDSAHVEECLSFAKKAGFISDQEAAEAEKVLPFIKSGQTPGGCTTKADCQKFCDDSSNNTECVNFAEKAGFMSKEDATMARITGGKGPGGCKSKDSCETYCNAKTHQQECFDFAQKYNLIPPDKLKEMREGMGRLRSGLDQMPQEAISCLKDNLGQDIVTKIQDGSFTPGPQTGDTIKGCFDKVMPQLQAKLKQGLDQATPAALQCLQNGLGEDGLQKIKNGEAPTPENGDVLKKCFGAMKSEGMNKLKNGLSKMPPEVRSCITEKLGADTVQKIQSGEDVNIGPEIGSAMQECAKAGVAAMQQKMDEGLKSAPPEIKSCVESKLGSMSAKMQSGELSGEADVQKLIQECVSNFKPAGGMPPPGAGGETEGNPPAGFAPTPEICSQFRSVPSCSYVPAGTAQDMCKKCKTE